MRLASSTRRQAAGAELRHGCSRRTTCAKYCRSFRSCNDVSRLSYRFSKRNGVSVKCCLQAAPPKGQVLDIVRQGEEGKLALRHGIANTH
jgi:hypothetical protein